MDSFQKKLEEILSGDDYNEFSCYNIVGIERIDNKTLKIKVIFESASSHGYRALHEIRIDGLKEYSITYPNEYDYVLEFLEDHPLLWTHTKRIGTLYFENPAKNPSELFTNIYKVHNTRSAIRIPIGKFLRESYYDIPYELCKQVKGEFAHGPIELLKLYKEELEKQGMNPSITDPFVEDWVDKSELKILIIGYSYFIGKSFDIGDGIEIEMRGENFS